MSDKLYELMDWPEIETIVYSEESEPRRILGPRVTEDGILIQCFLPGAVQARILLTKEKQTYDMVMEDEAGFFAVLIPEIKFQSIKWKQRMRKVRKSSSMILIPLNPRSALTRNSSSAQASAMRFTKNWVPIP